MAARTGQPQAQSSGATEQQMYLTLSSLTEQAQQSVSNVRQKCAALCETVLQIADGTSSITTEDVQTMLVDLLDTLDLVEKQCNKIPRQAIPIIPPTSNVQGSTAPGTRVSAVMQHSMADPAYISFDEVSRTHDWFSRLTIFNSVFFSQHVPFNVPKRLTPSSLATRGPTQLMTDLNPPIPFQITSTSPTHQQALGVVESVLKFVAGKVKSWDPSCNNLPDDEFLTFVQRSPSCCIALLNLPHVLRIAFVFRGSMCNIDHINVKGIDESFYTRAGELDVVSPSKRIVFQHVAEHLRCKLLFITAALGMSSSSGPSIRDMNHMNQTMRQFFFPLIPSYFKLFNDPCYLCNRVLRFGLPPICRQMNNIKRGLDVYHDTCK